LKYNLTIENNENVVGKDLRTMTENEQELISIIRESECPEKVAEYMLNLFLDHLNKSSNTHECDAS
jgi:hypothetical protein